MWCGENFKISNNTKHVLIIYIPQISLFKLISNMPLIRLPLQTRNNRKYDTC